MIVYVKGLTNSQGPDAPFTVLQVRGQWFDTDDFSYRGGCRSKKAQISAGPFGSIGDGPNNRGRRQYGCGRPCPPPWMATSSTSALEPLRQRTRSTLSFIGQGGSASFQAR